LLAPGSRPAFEKIMNQKSQTTLTPQQRRACFRGGMILLAIVLVFFGASIASHVV
jgi:hypothetical protein